MVQFVQNESPAPILDHPPIPGRVCFSFAAYARSVIDHLRRCQVPVARGLSDQELGAIEASFAFVFPPDLRSILQEGLPVGVGFPNWRSGAGGRQQLQMMVDLPTAGLAYDIAKGRFWWKDWGFQPSTSREALHIARKELSAAPTLIPIYTHCYIPSSPSVAGNPVFFVYQNDFYYAGYDVSDFFQREAFVPHDHLDTQTPRSASCIRDLIDTAHMDSCKGITASPRAIAMSDLFEGNSQRKDSSPLKSTYSQFHQKPVAAAATKVLTRFTIQAPSWAAKTASRIDFWSDLVENKHDMNVAAASANGMFSSDLKLEIDLTAKPARCKRVRWEDLGATELKYSSRKWVTSYLKDLQSRLRNGGWKEEDISDVINNSMTCSSSLQLAKICIDRQNYVENLATRFDVLSGSLRKGGWSPKDIVECFHHDTCKDSKVPAIE
jgi:hypothetical protein